MTRIRSATILLASLLLAACTAAPAPTSTPTPETPTPAPTSSATSPPTSPPGQPTPTADPTPVTTPPTSEPNPSATPSPGPTDNPAPTPSPPPDAFDPNAVTLTVERFIDGFTPLTLLTNAGDGSGLLYVVEQRGVVWPLDAAGVVAALPLLDIRDRIRSGGEQGLLGLAFHPDFESNGRLYVNYTNNAGNTVVSEFVRGADGQIDPSAERVLLGFDQPFSNHNGGMIAFGSDGYLYIATGDGGSADDPFGNGQNRNTLLGKMLRVDVNVGDPYAIPADNPFAAGGGLPEIWSYGLRNPWRFSFDRATGGMFIGDVGQNEREEVDVEPAGRGGRNYGWNTMEADRCFLRDNCDRSGLTLPAVSYGRSDGSCSVTGGYVYRGAQFPELYGAYVFSDYCSGTLWAFDAGSALESGRADQVQVGQSGLNPTSFGEDEAGGLYVVDGRGAIYRVIATAR